MDAVLAAVAADTINFGPVDDVKWRDASTPLYREFPVDVSVRRDQRCGPAERNLLDVFLPPIQTADNPVLVYIHGGGFFSGDKQWSDAVYSNVGYHFAQQGIITIVANHRLVPHVQYPGGAEDIRLIRDWVYANVAKDFYGNGSVNKVFLFGHSSGGAHICCDLFAAGDPELPQRDPLHPPVAGLLLLNCPFWFDRRKPARAKNLALYWGSDAEEVWGPKSPLGLFRQLPEDSPVLDSKRLPIYLGSVEWEIPETTDALIMFFDAYRARSKPAGTLPTVHVLKKHNHLSNILSIGTVDTAQADQIVGFINDCLGAIPPAKL